MSKKPRQIDGWQVKGEKVGVGQVGVAWDIYPGLIDWRVFYLGSGGSFSCWQGRSVCGRDAVWGLLLYCQGIQYIEGTNNCFGCFFRKC